MKQPNYLELYLIFLKIGALLLGGGYVIVPILQEELSAKRNLVTKEEILDFYAISQSLSGIIAVNTCIFVGYKLKGKLGAIIALLGLLTSPFLSIIILSKILFFMQNISILEHAFWGINIAIIILIFFSAKELLPCSIIDKFTFMIFLCVFFFTISGLSPIYSVILAMLASITYQKCRRIE